jgi:hypothetical protein
MAQTKKRAAPKKRSGGSQKPRSSGGGSAKGRTRKTRSRSKPRSTVKTMEAGAKSAGQAVEENAKNAGQAIEAKAKDAGQAVGKAASRAKVPLVAGGAALAGAAGGLALASARHNRHRGVTPAIRKPRIKLTSRDVARAAKEVGNFSAQVGAVATELERAREASNGSRHRSPVEVVLQGLTARR